MSRGSSHRSFLNPMGYEGYRGVRVANLMSARTWGGLPLPLCTVYNTPLIIYHVGEELRPCRSILLVMVIEAMHGVWLIEQPASSLLFESDRFRWLIAHLDSLNMRAL